MAAIRLFATALCLTAPGTAFAEDPLPRARPEDVGMSSGRLALIDSTLKADIEAGRIPGAVIAIARHGKLVMLNAHLVRQGSQLSDDHGHHFQHRLVYVRTHTLGIVADKIQRKPAAILKR